MRMFTLDRLHISLGRFPSVSSTYKCGHTRAMMVWCYDLLKKWPGSFRSRYTEARLLMFHSFIQHQIILKNAASVLTSTERAEAIQWGDTFLRQYMFCHEHRRPHASKQYRVVRRWKCRPKLHVGWEIMVQGLKESLMNPRYHAVWMDEDFCGRMSRLMSGCSAVKMSHASMLRHIRSLLGLYFRRSKCDDSDESDA